MNDIAIGIDFGTTNSVIALCNELDNIKLIEMNKKNIIPTIINYSNGIIFGGSVNSDDIVSIKREIGSNAIIQGRTIPDICTDIFKEINNSINKYLNNKKFQAVITVPAYFNDIQRNIVKQSALNAGINVLSIFNEPTAAILANEKSLNNGTYLVYDFGGGTFDVSVISFKDGIFQVLGTSGDTYLGGDDIDLEIAKANNISLKEARILKESNNHTVIIDNIIKKFANKTLDICDKLLKSLKLDKEFIDTIVAVGGSTKSEIIQEEINKFFSKKPLVKDPDTSVAVGAAIKAFHIINKTNHVLIDVNPLTLGIELYGGGVDQIIKRNTPIPCKKSEIYTISNDKQKYLDINILQGESELAANCTKIGKIKLEVNNTSKIKKPRFEVVFSINIEGILSVFATQIGTDITKKIVINPSFGLSKEKIINTIKKTYDNADIEIKNRLLNDLQMKAQDLKKVILESLKSDPDVIAKESVDVIKEKLNEIDKNINNINILKSLCNELEAITVQFAEKRIKKLFNSI